LHGERNFLEGKFDEYLDIFRRRRSFEDLTA
jgi:hypothetical protein